MLSRIENILQSIVDSSEYDGPVQSRIEQLLLDIKSVISAGGSGGVTEATVSTMITTAINSLIDSAPDEYNTLGKIAAHLLLTDEQIQTIKEQVNDRYTKEETNELVSKIPKFTIEVVTSLPTENISTTTVYLKTGAKSDPDNIYDEYIYVNSKWELLGTQKIDLTNFYTKEEADGILNGKVDKVSGKGLSTNDYTTAEKNKLAGIATGANKTVVDSDISTTSTNAIQNKAVGLKFQGVDSEISGINSMLKNKPNLADVYTRTDIDDKYYMTLAKGLPIAKNTDLNTVVTPGVYCISTESVIGTLKNTPGLLAANCRLEVFYSSETTTLDDHLLQKLYQNASNAAYVWIRGMTTSGVWSPWRLLNENDFTINAYNSADVNDKYVRYAVCQLGRRSYSNYTMLLYVYSTVKDISYNLQGILSCMVRTNDIDEAPQYMTCSWITKGIDIDTNDWFLTYNSKTKEVTLWKKIRTRYESYCVTLLSSSNRGNIPGSPNNIKMFFTVLDNTTDAYNSDDYAMIVTSTTCDSTAATKADIADIQEKVIDTGWITTGNLKYRKSGYIIALQGTVTPSGSTMSITLGTLPENCRPSQDINIAQAGEDTPSRYIAVHTGGDVVLLFKSNCTASHTYAYNGIFMI